MRLVWAIVTQLLDGAEGVQRLAVALDDRSTGIAIAYERLSGTCMVSDRVLLNATAVDLDLGTGGLHYVVARAGDMRGVAHQDSSGGHIMKLRYTPMQLDVCSVEEQASPHHETMKSAESLGGMAVACCGLHSQVPLVAAALKRKDPELKVAYVMTDGGALALHLSDLIRASCAAGLIDTTVTCGQAFGGQLEAVNLYSGLLAARHAARADVAIVAIGPGVVGTATPFGHGGVAQGEAINAVAALSGTPVAVVRASLADSRPRHRGVSHHTLSALMRVALAPALVALPPLPEEYAEEIEGALEDAHVHERHKVVRSSEHQFDQAALRGVEVRTMGRGSADDPIFFACAYAAGEVLARVAHGETKL